MTFNNILVVCEGNICRSPMVQALLKARYPIKHIESAGVSAMIDRPADPIAIEVMTAAQSDINNYMSRHISKQINTDLTVAADLILTMSTGQTKWIEARWPHCRGKTFRLGHWIDKDIADPYGNNISAFETAYQDIVDSLNHWQDKIS